MGSCSDEEQKPDVCLCVQFPHRVSAVCFPPGSRLPLPLKHPPRSISTSPVRRRTSCQKSKGAPPPCWLVALPSVFACMAVNVSSPPNYSAQTCLTKILLRMRVCFSHRSELFQCICFYTDSFPLQECSITESAKWCFQTWSKSVHLPSLACT